MIVMHAHRSTTLACSSVHISAGQGWASEEEWWTLCIASAKSRHSHFHYVYLYIHQINVKIYPSLCVSCIQSIHTQAAAARITRRCCTTSQLVIALVLHVCWYTYLNACTPVDIRAHYTCVQMAETGCPAGVQTARASTVSVLETPCVLMRIGALRINT